VDAGRARCGASRHQKDARVRKKIGFIGAGEMGARMARRLLAGGHDVSICDAHPAALAPFAAMGVRCSTVAADVGNSDVVILMVSEDAQLIDVVSGRAGVCSTLDAKRAPVILVMSTCLPKTVRAIRDAVHPLGARVVDAPVSGGPSGAEAGTLSVMLGGSPADIDDVTSVIGCMGQRTFHRGPLGSGQLVKLMNNMIGLTNLYLMSEALDIARRAGVDPARVAPALDASAGRNFLTQDIRKACQHYADRSITDDAFEALSRIVRKDLALASEVAHDAGAVAPLLDRIGDTIGHPDRSILERWRELGRMELGGEGSTPDS
jgi:3-hydroxyisobutyrate dehydrogenase